jgi:hypothetical protein
MKQCSLETNAWPRPANPASQPHRSYSASARAWPSILGDVISGSAGRGEAKFAPSAWEKLTGFEIGWADWWTCWVTFLVTHRSVVVSVPHPYLCRRDAAPYTRFRGRTPPYDHRGGAHGDFPHHDLHTNMRVIHGAGSSTQVPDPPWGRLPCARRFRGPTRVCPLWPARTGRCARACYRGWTHHGGNYEYSHTRAALAGRALDWHECSQTSLTWPNRAVVAAEGGQDVAVGAYVVA